MAALRAGEQHERGVEVRTARLGGVTKGVRQPWEAVGMTWGLETSHDVGTCYEIESKNASYKMDTFPLRRKKNTLEENTLKCE